MSLYRMGGTWPPFLFFLGNCQGGRTPGCRPQNPGTSWGGSPAHDRKTTRCTRRGGTCQGSNEPGQRGENGIAQAAGREMTWVNHWTVTVVWKSAHNHQSAAQILEKLSNWFKIIKHAITTLPKKTKKPCIHACLPSTICKQYPQNSLGPPLPLPRTKTHASLKSPLAVRDFLSYKLKNCGHEIVCVGPKIPQGCYACRGKSPGCGIHVMDGILSKWRG